MCIDRSINIFETNGSPLGMSQLCQKNCPLFYSIILLIIAIILKESTHYSTTHSNYAAELEGIFLFRDEMGLLKRSCREHGPEESREVCLLEELLFLSLLVPPSVDTERDRRDMSGLAAIASQITVHV